MAETNITINGRTYDIACDDGQEGRVIDLASYVDQRLQQIAQSGAAYSDSHLLVLTCLVLADELFESHGSGKTSGGVDQETILKVIQHLTERVENIAAKVEAA